MKVPIAIISVLLLFTINCKKDLPINKPVTIPAPEENKWLNKTNELFKHNSSKATISEGIAGTLTLLEGNCMPIVNYNSCKEYPIKRKIRIYEYTFSNQTKYNGVGVFEDVYTKLLTTIDSDKEGFYQINMPPSKYSLFIEENGKLYANRTDSNGAINPVIVDSKNVSIANLQIDYATH